MLLAGSPLAAQEVLNRTNPASQATREDPGARADQSVRIEIRPVLDMPKVQTDGGTLDVGAIVVDGLTVLDQSAFAAILEPFAGRPLERGEMVQLTDAVAARLRSEGYFLATAWIPQQQMVGRMLRVAVDEGRIDTVRIEGTQDPAVRRQLERLTDGRPVTLARLQREVLLADDIPGVWIRATRFDRDGTTRVLVVEVYRDGYGGSVQVATDGTKPLGPVRARIDLNANGLISPRDRVDLSFTANPVDPEEIAFFSARYSVVVNDAGTSVGLFGSYSRTQPGAYLASSDLRGEAWQGGVRVSHPLVRTQTSGVWLEASGELQDLSQTSFGTLARADRIALARIGYYAYGPFGGGTLQSRLTLTQGLGILGATRQGDALSSRLDAPADFTTLSWWMSWRRPLAERLSLQLAATGQLSLTPLLIGETFSLGGTNFLRGYDFAQAVGDRGVAGVAELRYDMPKALGAVNNLQLYAFADGGLVSSLPGGIGFGSLASSGGGLRTDITRDLDLDFEVAVPLTEPRYDTGDRSPRLNLRISQSF